MDVADLWFEIGEQLPGELATLAFELLEQDPSRLDGRCTELVNKAVACWTVRCPQVDELHAVARLLKPRTHMKRREDGQVGIDQQSPEEIPLVDLLTRFTKTTRPQPNFAQKFKLVNMVLMPYVVPLFGKP